MQTIASRSKACQGERWVPRDYQKTAVRWLVSRPEAALLLEPGLGKTAITLSAFVALKKAGAVHKALIIAPLRVAYLVWTGNPGGELARWADFQHLKVALLHGKDKAEALTSDADLFVINFDGLPWLIAENRLRQLIARGVDTLVVDELSKMKHTRTKRFRLLKPWLGRFRRRFGLTGSPASNGLLDLFGQIFVVDLGRSLGQWITKFRSDYFVSTGFGGYTWRIAVGAEKKIYAKIKNVALSMRASDHLDLPTLLEQNIYVVLPSKVQKIYDDLEEELIAAVEGGRVTAANAAVASNKCRQVTGGSIYADDNEMLNGGTKRRVHHVHDEKINALTELIDELNGSPLLVAYEYDHDLTAIRAALGDVPAINGKMKTADLEKTVTAWNNSELPVLAVHPASAAHGINMQHGECGHICFYSNPWDLELYQQLVRRVYRPGVKARRVFVHRIVVRKTIDEVIVRALTNKCHVQDELLDALKRRSRS